MPSDETSFNLDYPKLVAERSIDLELIDGQTLKQVLVNIVSHEFNVLYLKFASNWYAVAGEIGGEFISFRRLEAENSPKEEISANSGTFKYPPFDRFVGQKLAAVRHIGEAWNGHGFEFSFASLPSETLIVQSIYIGSESQNFFDCIRLGIGQYTYDATAFNKAL